MKTFTDICKLSPLALKSYMKLFLASKKYTSIVDDGFLYAKGDIPVLLVAHVDTVHQSLPESIINKNGKISSPQGIGGDDRCGVFMIMNIVSELHCSVLLCEDEEIGAIGAQKFCKTEHIKNLDVNYMIELDRKGSNDAVFYSCDNKEFEDFILDSTGFKKNWGSFTDISKLAPAAKIAAVNFSCGYYNAHTKDEYVVYDEMMDVVAMVKALIKTECNKSFEYIENKYEAANYSFFDDDYHCVNYNGTPGGVSAIRQYDTSTPKRSRLIDLALADLELEVVIDDMDGAERILYAAGKTKADCWADLFLNNPDVCFMNITDYTFM